MKSMKQAIPRRGILIGSALMMSVCFIPAANAENSDAEKLLKGMADYVASQKALTVTYDSDIEVITSNLQKIQFTSSGEVQLSRPDKLRARRTGGYRDVEIVFDGKLLTVNNKDDKDYAQIETTGTAEELIDVLREKHGVVAPGADLLLTNVFNVMMADVVEAAVIGKGVIDGVECDHLAFRNMETDWQIWIERVRSRSHENTSSPARASREAPQYTLRIKDWKTEVAADAFAFKPDPHSRRSRSANSATSTKSLRALPRQEQRNDPQIDRPGSSFNRHRTRCRRSVMEWATTRQSPSVADFLSGGPHRPSADANELRWRCQADHSPGRGRRGRSGSGGSRCGWSVLCRTGSGCMLASG